MANVRPKKHLGQHFLKDDNISKKIVSSLQNEAKFQVIEIGPGTGVLTKHLLSRFADFVALDVDEESIDYLIQTYPDHKKSFLHIDYLHEKQLNQCAIIGNFPYNISSQIFFKIWDDRQYVDEVVCMIQKEVAERIVAKHGNKTYGILSVLLQAFYDIEYLFEVPPQVFDPPPKVQSAVIRLKRNQVAELSCDEGLLKRVVKAGFGKRRKTLRNALKDLNMDVVSTLGDVLSQRAEQLSVAEFIALTEKISKG